MPMFNQSPVSGDGTPVTWASRPAAAPAGTVVRISDYGGPAGSRWISDGVRLYPCAPVLISAQVAINATPLATIVGSGVLQTAALPETPKIPAGMLFPGAKIRIDLRARKIGSAATCSYFGAGIHNSSAPGSTLATAQMGMAVPAAAGWIGPGESVATFVGGASNKIHTYPFGAGGSGPNVGGIFETTCNPSVDNFIVVQASSTLNAADSMAIQSLHVWVSL